MTQVAVTSKEPLTRRDRVRRVVLVCASFGRNLAYYRVGQVQGSDLHSESHPHASFWRQVNSNFLDLCVLEWCKLFGERDRAKQEYGWGEHGWRRIVSDPLAFEATLLSLLEMQEFEFGNLVEVMRNYRDKFVAHLDSDVVMNIPELPAAQASVWAYHQRIVEHDTANGDLAGLTDSAEKMRLGYEQCVAEASEIYRILKLNSF